MESSREQGLCVFERRRFFLVKLNKGSEWGGVEGDGGEQSLPVIFRQLSVTRR